METDKIVSRKELYYMSQIKRGNNTAYKIWINGKKNRTESSYKNVHKRISALERRGLVKRTSNVGEHGAITLALDESVIIKHIDHAYGYVEQLDDLINKI